MDRSLKFLSCVAAAGALYGVSLSAQVMTYSVDTQTGGGIGGAAVAVQPGGEPGPVTMMAAGKLFSFTSDEMERTIKNAPFTAQAVTTTTQVLGDGNRIVQTSETNLARDGEGRSRREMSIDKLGPWATDGTTHIVLIRDPVAGVAYQISPDGKTAMKTPMMAAPDADRLAAKMKAADAETKARMKTEAGHTMTQAMSLSARDDGEVGGFNVIIGGMEEGPAKKEALGDQNIEGVRATGTRETRTIAAGKIGNERPIEIVSETWYSPDLQMVVQSRRSDPRLGETIYRLTNIIQGEPDPGLFQLPAGVTVQDMRELKLRMEQEMRSRIKSDHPDQPEP